LDVEPIEAIVGISLIALALLAVIMVRPNPPSASPALRELSARSVASTVAYVYVWRYAYGELNSSEAQTALQRWLTTISEDSGLGIRVELNLSNGTSVLQTSWSFEVGDLSVGDVFVVQKPASVFLAPNGTAAGEIIFGRDPYGMEVPTGVDPLNLTVAFYDLRSRQPLDVGNVSINAQYTCSTTCPCLNATICTLIDPDLSGSAQESGFLYIFDQRKSLLTCETPNGSTVALCPVSGPIDVTASYSGETTVSATGTGTLLEIPMAVSWLSVSPRNASVGEVVNADLGQTADFSVYSLIDGKVILQSSSVTSVSIDLSDPFGVLPGIMVVEADAADSTYRNAFFVRPYILFVRVEMGGVSP